MAIQQMIAILQVREDQAFPVEDLVPKCQENSMEILPKKHLRVGNGERGESRAEARKTGLPM